MTPSGAAKTQMLITALIQPTIATLLDPLARKVVSSMTKLQPPKSPKSSNCNVKFCSKQKRKKEAMDP